MAWVEAPAGSTRPLWFGAAGGVAAGCGSLLVACLLATTSGHAPVAVVNGLGAWAVRWLQAAAPQALDNLYPDATPGGLALALALSALGGAVFGGLVERSAEDNPMAWGLVAGAVLWAAGRWVLLPAFSPVLALLLGPLPLALVCLTYGLGLGLWQAAGRRVRLAAHKSTAWP